MECNILGEVKRRNEHFVSRVEAGLSRELREGHAALHIGGEL